MFGLPVQCFVFSPLRWSAIDQMLKYGSCATSGTAGGRDLRAAQQAEQHANVTKHANRLAYSAGKLYVVFPFVASNA